jgi:uncharacterized membrane-anchored protein YhcB (DUF1043 family)
MDWTQTLTTIIATFALLFGFIIYLMNRMDSNKRDTDRKVEASFKELEHKIESFQKDSSTKFEAVNSRFNGIENRLTAMEVEIKNTNQRLTTIEGYLMPNKIFRFEETHKEDHNEPKEN